MPSACTQTFPTGPRLRVFGAVSTLRFAKRRLTLSRVNKLQTIRREPALWKAIVSGMDARVPSSELWLANWLTDLQQGDAEMLRRFLDGDPIGARGLVTCGKSGKAIFRLREISSRL
mmetsp:Transcript_128080/g.410496  ORF Transcript_128080/g.410496 Transcript_128080/m.410496 type:complete len:117 (-) Transcript_128080:732-1082(-)